MRGSKSKKYRALARTLTQTLEVPELERPVRQRLKRHAEKTGDLDSVVLKLIQSIAKYRAGRDLGNALDSSSPTARHSGGGDGSVSDTAPDEEGAADESVRVLESESGSERDHPRDDTEELVRK